MLDNQPIAKGTTADIYAWGEGRILKLFHAHQSRESVEYEAHIGRLIAAAGLAVPQVFDVIEEEERWGIVYERVADAGMTSKILPWQIGKYGRDMAHLHTTLFSRQIPDLPRQRERLTQRVSTAPHLREIERRRLLNLLDSLPDGDLLCHGDFHPLNVMGEGIIIDWMDATQGHPTADIARTILILEELNDLIDVFMPQIMGADLKVPWVVKRLIVWVMRYGLRRMLLGYRQEIERLVPDAKALIPRWMPVLAAARLHEGQYTQPPSSSLEAQAQQSMIDRMVKIARGGV